VIHQLEFLIPQRTFATTRAPNQKRKIPCSPVAKAKKRQLWPVSLVRGGIELKILVVLSPCPGPIHRRRFPHLHFGISRYALPSSPKAPPSGVVSAILFSSSGGRHLFQKTRLTAPFDALAGSAPSRKTPREKEIGAVPPPPPPRSGPSPVVLWPGRFAFAIVFWH